MLSHPLVGLQLKLQSLEELVAESLSRSDVEKSLSIIREVVVDAWETNLCSFRITADIDEDFVTLDLWRLEENLDEASEDWVEFFGEWAKVCVDFEHLFSFDGRLRSSISNLHKLADEWSMRREKVELVFRTLLCEDGQTCENQHCPKISGDN